MHYDAGYDVGYDVRTVEYETFFLPIRHLRAA